MGEFSSSLFRSFRTKVLLPLMTIMAGLIGLIAWLVNSGVEAQFRAESARALETAEGVFRHSQDIRTRYLLERFRSLPLEPRYKAVFQAGDAPTLRELLKDLVQEHDVDIAVFTARDGQVLAHYRRDAALSLPAFSDASSEAAAVASEAGESVDTVVVGETLYDLILVSVNGVGNTPIGTLIIASEVGEAVAREFSLLASSQIVLMAQGRITSSTLPRHELQPHMLELDSARVTPLMIGGEHFFVSAGRFSTLSGEAEPSYILLTSYEKSLQALRSVQRTIFVVSLVAVVLGGAVIWFFVRRVAAPLEQLHDGVEAVAQGDLSRRIEVGSNDECGHLAVVFNRMAANLHSSRAELENTLVTLKSTQAQLVQSEKLSAIGEFVAGVAHELNNPLATVIGFSEMLLARGLDARTGHQLDQVHKNARRCQKIVQGLLSFARRHQPERTAVNLNTVAESASEFLQYQMRTSNVTVVLTLDPSIPAFSGDAHQLQQVVVNILNNARQAIEGHQPSGRIEIRTSAAEGTLRLVIEDNGPGIPAEHLGRIFDPFFTTKEVGRGTGLGLSLCYGIIKEHGGNITARSTPGCGATFLIELPATTLPAPQVEPPSSCSEPGLRDLGGGRRILVVDDEEGIRDMVKEVLALSGFTVDTVADGAEAIHRLTQGEYAATLCDWRMPGMGGDEVYAHLKANTPHLAERFVFMTGDVASEVTRRFMEEQGCRMIPKPFTMDQFNRVLHEVLGV